MKTVAFCTLGCKVNQYETNAMIQQFIKRNYSIVSFNEKADIYIINTCTVTNMSDRKSRQMLRRARTLNNNAIIVAIGCYAEVGKEDLLKINEIDLVLGNNEKANIVDILEQYEDIKKMCIVSDVNLQKEYMELGITTYTEKTRAFIKIQDGCNNFCSYCLIPYARGRIRSRNPEKIIAEVSEIVNKGIKEIVLTGINISFYGKDFKEKITLIDLLIELNKIDGLERIRLGSIEPNLITEEFADDLLKIDKLCNHFHLSLQSGCDETLKRMNRKYTIEEFKEVVERLRKRFKNVALTTDIIVGFPGETEEEFNKTFDFLKEIKFSKMHIFRYSVRNGTVAAKMPNQVPEETKEERSRILIQLSNKNEDEFINNMIGKEEKVLFEEQIGEFYRGHTTNYIVVNAKGVNLENDIKTVKITKQEKEEAYGEIL